MSPSVDRAVLAVCACTAVTAAVLPAAADPAASARLTLRAGAEEVRFPEAVTLSGRLSGADAGSRRIELRSNRYPYPGFARIGRTVTRANGSYSFRVAPTRNTRYRTVAVGGDPAASGAVSVVERAGITWPPCNYCGRRALPRSGFVIRNHGTIEYPPEVRLSSASRKLYVYAAFDIPFRGNNPVPGTRLSLRGVRGSLVPTGGGGFRWRVAFRAPPGTDSFYYTFCWRDPAGFGRLNGSHNCGLLRTVRYPVRYLG